MEKIPFAYYQVEPVDYETWREFPSREEAYEQTVLSSLSERLDVPVSVISEEAVSHYESTLISVMDAASLLKLHPENRVWPAVVARADVEPEFTFKYKYTSGRGIATATYYDTGDVPKLLIAAATFNKPESAKTVKEVSAAVKKSPYYIYEVLKQEELMADSFRDPQTEEFDEYLRADTVRAILTALQKRRR